MNKKVFFLLLLFLISIGLIIILNKLPKKDRLVGLWNIDGNTKYEFNGEGRGKLIVSSGEYLFTYNIEDNILFIDFDNETSKDTKYTFTIKNNELEINNLDEQHLKYILKKDN